MFVSGTDYVFGVVSDFSSERYYHGCLHAVSLIDHVNIRHEACVVSTQLHLCQTVSLNSSWVLMSTLTYIPLSENALTPHTLHITGPTGCLSVVATHHTSV